MKVKKFKGATMPEVMQIVRRELGQDAVILNSKEIYEGGFLGLFKKKKIEVLAAMDQQQTSTVQKQNSAVREQDHSEKKTENTILNELREMKRWIQNNSDKETEFPYPYQQMYDHMLDQEVKPHIANELLDTILKRNKSDKEQNIDKIKIELAFEMKHRLANKGQFGNKLFEKQIVQLVGPTGVGKTTTIAKLAAHCVLNEQKKVALITTDTYRIAAIEQLKTYSKILDIPIEIAYSFDDYKKAREKFSDYDIILVDTAGRNFRDEKYVKELGNTIDLYEEAETYLVLSLTSRTKDMEEIYKQFQTVPLKQVIFTKRDETSIYGSILNMCLEQNTGIAFITNGQDVPDDIEEASIDNIAKIIVGD
ncbi:flagellar biosynthesis protein FlhF [Gracilibacillus ureilyticus]|uniref:Flagellar biosynthesis protein FlhF n=1 Tax=Gracilibacillus ureilyticus TaxID=531814 RepID=A0A1H9L6P2_9BACI|nr:flagellar biosynthesis protein FlhF [Gracilibacillus ureilyticus]SER06817.1 flagellar biosynthesis protein FlhF [Gracilibacillus ureilyticus]